MAIHSRMLEWMLQTGQSLPQTTRSQPKHSMQCSIYGLSVSSVGGSRRAIGGNARDLAGDMGKARERLDAGAPASVVTAGDVRHAAMIEDELHVADDMHQLRGDRQLAREKIDVEGQIARRELLQVAAEHLRLRDVVRGLVENAPEPDHIRPLDPI